MNLYKKCTAKLYSFLVLILLLNWIILHVSERIFEKEYKMQSWQLMLWLEMKIYNMILTTKQQKVKISALLSGKTDKH